MSDIQRISEKYSERMQQPLTEADRAGHMHLLGAIKSLRDALQKFYRHCPDKIPFQRHLKDFTRALKILEVPVAMMGPVQHRKILILGRKAETMFEKTMSKLAGEVSASLRVARVAYSRVSQLHVTFGRDVTLRVVMISDLMQVNMPADHLAKQLAYVSEQQLGLYTKKLNSDLWIPLRGARISRVLRHGVPQVFLEGGRLGVRFEHEFAVSMPEGVTPDELEAALEEVARSHFFEFTARR